jgi:hypothetical protein
MWTWTGTFGSGREVCCCLIPFLIFFGRRREEGRKVVKVVADVGGVCRQRSADRWQRRQWERLDTEDERRAVWERHQAVQAEMRRYGVL